MRALAVEIQHPRLDPERIAERCLVLIRDVRLERYRGALFALYVITVDAVGHLQFVDADIESSDVVGDVHVIVVIEPFGQDVRLGDDDAVVGYGDGHGIPRLLP